MRPWRSRTCLPTLLPLLLRPPLVPSEAARDETTPSGGTAWDGKEFVLELA